MKFKLKKPPKQHSDNNLPHTQTKFVPSKSKFQTVKHARKSRVNKNCQFVMPISNRFDLLSPNSKLQKHRDTVRREKKHPQNPTKQVVKHRDKLQEAVESHVKASHPQIHTVDNSSQIPVENIHDKSVDTHAKPSNTLPNTKVNFPSRNVSCHNFVYPKLTTGDTSPDSSKVIVSKHNICTPEFTTVDTSPVPFQTNIFCHDDRDQKKSDNVYKHPIDKKVAGSKNNSNSLDSEASNIFEVSDNGSQNHKLTPYQSMPSPTLPKLTPQKNTFLKNLEPLQNFDLFLEPELTPQKKSVHKNSSFKTFEKSSSNSSKNHMQCSSDQWPILKPIFHKIKDSTEKIIKQQFHISFIEHCIIHNTKPEGLNLNPICLNFVKNSKHAANWDATILKLGRDLLRTTIKALRDSTRQLYSEILSHLGHLRELASDLNYEALYSNISRRAKLTAKTQLNKKINKSLKLFNCQNFKVEHFHSNIFKINIKLKCRSLQGKRKSRRKRKPMEPPPTTVVNLSNHELSDAETKLLKRNLKFCPTPKKVDNSKIASDTYLFNRKMRLKEYFYDQSLENIQNLNNSSQENQTYKLKSQKIDSLWTPKPGRNKQLDEFCCSIQNYTSNIPQSTKHDNISLEERQALDNFRKTINKDIVIRSADKGGAVVVQNRSDYINTCDSILSDVKFYQKLDYDPTEEFQTELKKILTNAFKEHDLPENLKMQDLIQRFTPSPGRFYTLPKIHKNISPPPGRPIISGNGMVTERISGFVSYFLNSLVSELPSYIQDTTHFLLELEKLKVDDLPPDSFLATLDVVSLYPNIPHKEGCEASEYFLNKRLHPDIPTSFLMILINFVLTHNNFVFNKENYIQLNGTAMGTKMGPGYACLFMGKFELDFLGDLSFSPIFWKRFIDDIFLIWTHGEEKFNLFLEKINSVHPNIKFESTKSNSIPFLDVLVKFENGKIETDLYTKPTDSHNYLDWNSCHPKSTKIGIPFSQALRIRRICSKDSNFNFRLSQLESYLHFKKYPSRIIKEAFEKVKKVKREEALLYKKRETTSRITFPIEYHPNIQNLVPTVHEKFEKILLQEPSNKNIYPEPPMIAFKRPPNLKDMITRASIAGPNNSEPGMQNCPDLKCPVHPHINTSKTVFSLRKNRQLFDVTKTFNCKDHNIVYLISCKKTDCKAQYVGETGRTFQERAKEHIRSVIQTIEGPISNHFSHNGHSETHLSFQILEKCKYVDTAFRRERENHYIKLLEPSINIQNTS